MPADVLVLADTSPENGRQGQAAAALLRHLNARADMITLGRIIAGRPASSLALTRPQVPAQVPAEWEARLDLETSPYAHPGSGQSVSTVVWRSQRPLPPERLADALNEAMLDVLRSRGHLWLASRPDAVITWRSAGGHLEIREADRWLEAPRPRLGKPPPRNAAPVPGGSGTTTTANAAIVLGGR